MGHLAKIKRSSARVSRCLFWGTLLSNPYNLKDLFKGILLWSPIVPLKGEGLFEGFCRVLGGLGLGVSGSFSVRFSGSIITVTGLGKP